MRAKPLSCLAWNFWSFAGPERERCSLSGGACGGVPNVAGCTAALSAAAPAALAPLTPAPSAVEETVPPRALSTLPSRGGCTPAHMASSLRNCAFSLAFCTMLSCANCHGTGATTTSDALRRECTPLQYARLRHPVRRCWEGGVKAHASVRGARAYNGRLWVERGRQQSLRV